MPGGFPGTPGATTPQPQAQYGQYRTQAPPPNPDYLHPSYVGAAGATANGGDSDENLTPISDSINDPSSNPGSSNSQEHLPDGARSPGAGSERISEASHFTSISERPVNPAWQPPPGQRGGPGSAYGGAPRPMKPRQEDVILGANPDFSIPGMGPARGGGRPGNRPVGMGAAASGGAGGVVPGGRYPTEF